MFLLRGSEIDIFLENNTTESITNIVLSTSEKLKVVTMDNIKPHESVSTFLSMLENKSDGNYTLTFKRANGKIEFIRHGNYTNDAPINKSMDVVVEKDTSMIEYDMSALSSYR